MRYLLLICVYLRVLFSANPEYMATVDEDGGLIIFNTKKSGALAVAQGTLDKIC